MPLFSTEVKKIAVFRPLTLGDMLCHIPAMRALRRAFPKAHITLLGMSWASQFVNRFSYYFDGFVHFPGYPGLPEQSFKAEDFTYFLAKMQEEKFDLVLQMHGNGTITNPLIELFGGRINAGFFRRNDYKPNSEGFLEYPQGISEIDRHLKLLEHLGIASQGNELEFPLTQEDYDDFTSIGLDVEPDKYVCVHPGSRGAWRQWPTEYFATLADFCIEQDMKVVLTGTKEELPIVEEVIGTMKHKALNAAGKTSLGAIGVLIKNAAALIANCTSVSQIASALETPSIIINMDGEPERWGALNKVLHRTIDWKKTPDFGFVYNETVTLLENDVA